MPNDNAPIETDEEKAKREKLLEITPAEKEKLEKEAEKNKNTEEGFQRRFPDLAQFFNTGWLSRLGMRRSLGNKGYNMRQIEKFIRQDKNRGLAAAKYCFYMAYYNALKEAYLNLLAAIIKEDRKLDLNNPTLGPDENVRAAEAMINERAVANFLDRTITVEFIKELWNHSAGGKPPLNFKYEVTPMLHLIEVPMALTEEEKWVDTKSYYFYIRYLQKGPVPSVRFRVPEKDWETIKSHIGTPTMKDEVDARIRLTHEKLTEMGKAAELERMFSKGKKQPTHMPIGAPAHIPSNPDLNPLDPFNDGDEVVPQKIN